MRKPQSPLNGFHGGPLNLITLLKYKIKNIRDTIKPIGKNLRSNFRNYER